MTLLTLTADDKVPGRPPPSPSLVLQPCSPDLLHLPPLHIPLLLPSLASLPGPARCSTLRPPAVAWGRAADDAPRPARVLPQQRRPCSRLRTCLVESVPSPTKPCSSASTGVTRDKYSQRPRMCLACARAYFIVPPCSAVSLFALLFVDCISFEAAAKRVAREMP